MQATVPMETNLMEVVDQVMTIQAHMVVQLLMVISKLGFV